MDSSSKVRRVLWYTLILNLTVAGAKIAYGYLSDSISMTADGFHSMLDGSSNVIGLIGIWIASQPPDESHPYGHRKFETFASLAVAGFLFITSFEILKKSLYRFITPNHPESTITSFVIMGITLSVNIGVMLYEKKKGRELKSSFLIADSMHTMSDIFVSISVIITLIAIKIGYPMLDAVAAAGITIIIGRTGYRIVRESSDVLMDASVINGNRIRDVVMTVKGAKECHRIRTRGMQGHIYVDLHVKVDPEMSINDAHDISYFVEQELKKRFAEITDVVVHIEPYRQNSKADILSNK